MKQPVLSICIPTYNRSHELERLIRDNLCLTNETGFEIVVSDNCSSDDTLERLGKIHDERLRVLRNNKNLGSWENGARVLTSGAGKYSMILLDKDRLDLRRISDILPILSKIDVAAGRFVLDAKGADKPISCKVRKGIYNIVIKEGLKFSHPSGFFFKTEILKRENIFGMLREEDATLRPYSTDFQVLLMAKHGTFAVIDVPLVTMQLPPFKGIKWSFTYQEDENLYFLPQYRYRVLVLYVNMMRKLNIATPIRLRAVVKYVKLLYQLSTSGYINILGQDNICNWYGLSKEYRERQLCLPLRKEFRDRFANNDDIKGIDGLFAKAYAFWCLVRHLR